MKLRFHNVMAACLLIVAIGGNLVTLQMVAWMGMLVSYSQQDGLSAAIEKTFDGKHPCKICKVVKKGSADEHEKQVVKSATKIDWILSDKSVVAWTATWVEVEWQADDFGHLRFVSPSIPPPKAA